MNKDQAANLVTISMIWTGLMILISQGWLGDAAGFVKAKVHPGTSPLDIYKTPDQGLPGSHPYFGESAPVAPVAPSGQGTQF